MDLSSSGVGEDNPGAIDIVEAGVTIMWVSAYIVRSPGVNQLQSTEGTD